MDLIKFLIEEPGKIKLLIINFFKLLLTLLIAHGVFKLCEYNILYNLIHWNSRMHIGNLLLYVAIIVATWFVLWYFIDGLFLFLISMRGTTKVDLENERRGFIYSGLRFLGAYSEEEKKDEKEETHKHLLPGKNIHTIIDVAEYVETEETFDMKNSVFAEMLFILTIGWFYVLFNFQFLGMSCWKLFLWGLIPGLGIAIYRTLDGFLIHFKDHSSSYSKFFEMLEYRKLVMDVVLQDFRGRVNIIKNTFDLNWGKRRYHLRDFAFYHEGLGNAYLIKHLQSASADVYDFKETIAVMNFKPNAELTELFQKKGIIGIVVAGNDEELLDNLVEELNRLKALEKNGK